MTLDIKKLLAECEFHIKRGDSMIMEPSVVKQLIGDILKVKEYEEFSPIQTGRDFEAEKVAAQKVLQPADVVRELIEAADSVECDAEEYLDFDELTAMIVPIDTYHRLVDALDKAKEHGL